MSTNIEILRELDELVEASRLLGVTQAKKGFGCYTDEDRRFERAMRESIDKHRAEIERLHEQLRLATVDQAIAEAEASDAHAENKRLQESLAALSAVERDAPEAAL